MKNRNSKAMMWIKLGKQKSQPNVPPKSKRDNHHNLAKCMENLQRKFSLDIRQLKTFHIHELNINEIRSQSHHNAEMLFILNRIDINVCKMRAKAFFSGRKRHSTVVNEWFKRLVTGWRLYDHVLNLMWAWDAYTASIFLHRDPTNPLAFRTC